MLSPLAADALLLPNILCTVGKSPPAGLKLNPPPAAALVAKENAPALGVSDAATVEPIPLVTARRIPCFECEKQTVQVKRDSRVAKPTGTILSSCCTCIVGRGAIFGLRNATKVEELPCPSCGSKGSCC